MADSASQGNIGRVQDARRDPVPDFNARVEEIFGSVTISALYRNLRSLFLNKTPQWNRELKEIFVVAASSPDDPMEYSTKAFVGDRSSVSLPMRSIISMITATGSHFEQGWIMSHYHPTKNARPSIDDNNATAAVSFIAKQSGAPLLDHWIFGADGSFFSYANSDPGFLKPSVEFHKGETKC